MTLTGLKHSSQQRLEEYSDCPETVSYTHLTLPTSDGV